MPAGVHCMHIGTHLLGQISHLHKVDQCSLCALLDVIDFLQGTAHLPSAGFQCSSPLMGASLALIKSACMFLNDSLPSQGMPLENSRGL